MNLSPSKFSPIRRTTRRRPWRRHSAGFFALVLVGMAVFLWATSSNDGVVAQTPPGSQAAQAPVPDKTYDGTLVTFTYGGNYALKSRPALAPDLELVRLSDFAPYDKDISVSVSQLPGGSLSNDGDYIYRQTFTNLYARRQLPVDGGTATIWVKVDGTEQTAFIPHGDKVAAVSFVVNGTNDPGDLQGELNTLLASFHWK